MKCYSHSLNGIAWCYCAASDDSMRIDCSKKWLGTNTERTKLMQMIYFSFFVCAIQLGSFAVLLYISLKMTIHFFCVEKKLAGFLLSFHELTFVQLFAFLYLSHKHNIIRSINAWYYYDGRSFCRLFVW